LDFRERSIHRNACCNWRGWKRVCAIQTKTSTLS